MTTLNNGQISLRAYLGLGGIIDSLIDLTTSTQFMVPYAGTGGPVAIITTTWGDPLGATGTWPLNMTQAWNQGGGPSTILDWSNNGTTIYTKTQMIIFEELEGGDQSGSWILEQWITLLGKVAKVHSKVTYDGPDRSGDRDNWPGETARVEGIDMWNQECPALAINSNFHAYQLYYYVGASPWTSGALTGPVYPPEYDPENPPTEPKPNPTEKWIAAVDTNGYGLGMYSPDADYMPHLVGLGGQGTSNPYMAGGIAHGFSPTVGVRTGPILEYTNYFTVGTVTEIRSAFYAVREGIDPLTSSSAIENVELILTHGEFSIEASDSLTTINTPTIIRQGGEFTIDECSAASTIETIEIVQSYGVLAISDCAATSAITTPTITLNSNGSGIRSPSGTAYTPRSIIGEQLTIRRYSNGAWT
jgi:hypothetical protein